MRQSSSIEPQIPRDSDELEDNNDFLDSDPQKKTYKVNIVFYII